MFAKKQVSVETAITGVIELMGLNEVKAPTETLRYWKEFQYREDSCLVTDPFGSDVVTDPFGSVVEGLEGLRRAKLVHLSNTESVFDVKPFCWEGMYGIAYNGQFTGGRYIDVYRQLGAAGYEYWVKAETGTDRPSRYFSEFSFMKENLAEICGQPWPCA